ncbi:MAG: phosphoribosylglycinamide formyltransferase [Acidobacteriota bacterium]
MTAAVRSFGVLISGRGSNMISLIEAARDGTIPARAAIVVSNVAGAPGLARAAALGVETVCIPHQDSPSRREHDLKVVEALSAHGVDLVCLAGYMRLLTPAFIEAFPRRILNIHPSLLPAFPGLHAQRQALEHGVKQSGCTVHLVDRELDHGPILCQAAVAVRDDDDEESLAGRILEVEHRLYPEAVRLFLTRALTIDGRRVRLDRARDM